MATEKQSMLQNGKSCTLNHPPVSTGSNTSCKASDVGLGIRNQIPCKTDYAIINQVKIQSRLVFFPSVEIYVLHTHMDKIKMANKCESKTHLK